MQKLVGFFLLGFVVSFATQVYSGPLQRVPNSTLQMRLVPPVVGFTTTNAFGNLVLDRPFALASPPGETNRLFILEKVGRTVVITNLANPTRTLFLDISDHVSSAGNEEGLLGMAFHSNYAANRKFYLFYTGPYVTTNFNGSQNGTQRTHRVI